MMRIKGLFRAQADAEARTITLAFHSEGEQVYGVVFDYECAATCAAAILAETGALAAQLGDGPPAELQQLNGTVELGLDPDGNPILLIDLGGGATIPIRMATKDLNELSAQLYLLTAPHSRST